MIWKHRKMVEEEVKYVAITAPVRYEEEDIPNNFPLRTGDIWEGTVEIDTGKIIEWPVGKSGVLAMKVTDTGSYALQNSNHQTIAEIIENYCPNACIPGEYGDYIHLVINEQGIIENWPKHPDLSAWEEEY